MKRSENIVGEGSMKWLFRNRSLQYKIIKMNEIEKNLAFIFEELSQLIAQTRQKVVLHINTSITQLYWRIGEHIHRYLLTDGRADYGKRILQTVSAKLTQEYGKGLVNVIWPIW